MIEHNPLVRADLVRLLASAGYHVRDASNGFSGLRLALGVVPDAIVLGIELPEVSAGEVREQLGVHPRTREVPILPLASTAGPVTREVRQALRDAIA